MDEVHVKGIIFKIFVIYCTGIVGEYNMTRNQHDYWKSDFNLVYLRLRIFVQILE